jgi:heptaprenylglyceryl phosphate synthase
MKKVDQEIGKVLREIEGTDTIVVFTSDHGEYAASHGLRGKGVSVYRESTQVPLFVYDPLGQYTTAPEIPRQGLTSSVDVFRLVMTIANQGSTNWLQQNSTYKTLYSGRHNLFAMLRQPNVPGRSFILHTCDEPIPQSTQYHVIGYRTAAGALAYYSSWDERSGKIASGAATAAQYFDFSQGNNTLELIDTANSAQAQQALQMLQGLINTELRKPMTSQLEAVKQRMINNRYTYLNSAIYDSLPERVFDVVNW